MAVSGVESSVIPRLSLVTVQIVVGTSLVQLKIMGLFRNCRSGSERQSWVLAVLYRVGCASKYIRYI